jgi:site-specific recombinase XerC
VADLLDAWLKTLAPTLRPSTLAAYTSTCDIHLRPALGAVRLARLSPAQIQATITALQGAGQHRTALKAYRALFQALALAVRWGWLASNPAERVDPPRYRAERKTLWTLDQLANFLDGHAGHGCAVYLAALPTGARPRTAGPHVGRRRRRRGNLCHPPHLAARGR